MKRGSKLIELKEGYLNRLTDFYKTLLKNMNH